MSAELAPSESRQAVDAASYPLVGDLLGWSRDMYADVVSVVANANLDDSARRTELLTVRDRFGATGTELWMFHFFAICDAAQPSPVRAQLTVLPGQHEPESEQPLARHA